MFSGKSVLAIPPTWAAAVRPTSDAKRNGATKLRIATRRLLRMDRGSMFAPLTRHGANEFVTRTRGFRSRERRRRARPTKTSIAPPHVQPSPLALDPVRQLHPPPSFPLLFSFAP